MKQSYDAEVFKTRLQFFVIKKNDVSPRRKTSLKIAVNMENLKCLLATDHTLNLKIGLLFSVGLPFQVDCKRLVRVMVFH